jgi:hypothetical protein
LFLHPHPMVKRFFSFYLYKYYFQPIIIKKRYLLKKT